MVLRFLLMRKTRLNGNLNLGIKNIPIKKENCIILRGQKKTIFLVQDINEEWIDEYCGFF